MTRMNSRISLGTAQFGLAYGITNKLGKPSVNDVELMLQKACNSGIQLLDTAPGYGDAEQLLGSIQCSRSFRITSKLKPISQPHIDDTCTAELEKQLQCSLSSLRRDALDTLLLHNADDMTKPGAAILLDWLVSLKERGLVSQIGMSIYEPRHVEIANLDLFDIVQLPLSLYDQRMVHNGTVDRLIANGIAIQARSIYLQGLILTPVDKWPAWIGQNSRNHHRNLCEFVESRNSSLLGQAISYIKNQKWLDSFIVGITSISELDELLLACDSPALLSSEELNCWSLDDNVLLDPRIWPA